jgi:hypothetical protein
MRYLRYLEYCFEIVFLYGSCGHWCSVLRGKSDDWDIMTSRSTLYVVILLMNIIADHGQPESILKYIRLLEY